MPVSWSETWEEMTGCVFFSSLTLLKLARFEWSISHPPIFSESLLSLAAVWNTNTEKGWAHQRLLPLSVFLSLSHIISLCLCYVCMSARVHRKLLRMYVHLCTDNWRGGPVCCPRGSGLIKAESVSLQVHKQPACRYTHTHKHTHNRELRGREMLKQSRRGRLE